MVWLISLGFLFSNLAQAEQFGLLKIDSLVLRPQFRVAEPSDGDFAIGESMFSVRWRMDQRTSAVFAVGAKNLLGTSIHYKETVTEDLGFVEGYGEFAFEYGTIRAGLLPVDFGLEGSRREADLDLDRSLLFARRWVPLRDIGLSYRIDYDGYFTRLMVHNGESDANVDGRMWYTGAWGYESPRLFQFGVAGQTGSTKPESTNASNDSMAGVDPSREAKWRMGGPFAAWTPHHWRLELEVYLGELVQAELIRKFSTGHVSFGYEWTNWSLHARYDQIDPDQGVDGNRETRPSVAFGYLSERRTSKVYVLLTKVIEESNQVPNDEIRLIWHLTPEIPP
jgi:hypothetical protein